MTAASSNTGRLHVAAVLPVHDDWTSAAELLRQLDPIIAPLCTADVILVDDAPNQPYTCMQIPAQFSAIRTISVLRLRRNLGHQRAIAIGLVYVDQSVPCDAVLVMDADGEDTPSGVAQLVRAFNGQKERPKAIFAERTRRTESLVFAVSTLSTRRCIAFLQASA